MRLERVPLDLASLVGGVALQFAPSARAKGLTFDVDLDADMCTTAIGDPTRLREDLASLVAGAVELTKHGGILMSVSTTATIDDHVDFRVVIRTATGQRTNLVVPLRVAVRSRLLVVEDNPLEQMVVTAMLSELGHTVDVANDGEEAVRLAAANDYGLIFMDCQMPRMDGYAATAAIRALPHPKCDVAIVALTASALAEDRQRCFENGMDNYMTKPVAEADLVEVLQKFVTHSDVDESSG